RDGGAGDPDGLRRDADPAAVQSGERELEALADLAEHRVRADARLLEDDRARVRCAEAHLRLGLADGQPRRVALHDERGDAFVWGPRGIALTDPREHDEQRRVARARDELFASGEAPA